VQALTGTHLYPAVNNSNRNWIFGNLHFYSKASHHGMQDAGINKSPRASIERKALVPEGAYQTAQFFLFFDQQGADPFAAEKSCACQPRDSSANYNCVVSFFHAKTSSK